LVEVEYYAVHENEFVVKKKTDLVPPPPKIDHSINLSNPTSNWIDRKAGLYKEAEVSCCTQFPPRSPGLIK